MVGAAKAALVLLALYPNAAEARQCASDSIGVLEGVKVELPTVVLTSEETTLGIPDDCYVWGPNYKYIGMEVIACDNTMPLVEAKSLHLAIIGLKNVSGSALASVTQYCLRAAHSQEDEEEGQIEKEEPVPLSSKVWSHQYPIQWKAE